MHKNCAMFLLAIGAFALSTVLPLAATAGERHRSVSLTLWGGGGGTADEHPLTMSNLNLTDLDQTLDNMQSIGVDTVGVNVFWLQDNIGSYVISPDTTGATGFKGTATTGVTEAVIDAIHAKGMSVMLKPLVNLRNDPSHWRGQISGSNTWMWGSTGTPHDGTHVAAADDPYDGYANFIYHWADVAQAKGVETFCIGTEFAAASGGTANETRWRGAIGAGGGDGVGGAGSGILNRYDGKLTYAAQNGWWNSPRGQDATSANIKWWDAMDYLGVDAYYPLTNYQGQSPTGTTSPTPEQLQAAWTDAPSTWDWDYIAMLQAWRAANGNKPVMFTEVGYTSDDGTNMHPWQVPGLGSEDQQEQADCYEALLSELWDEQWWVGAYWWNWEIDPDPSDWNHAPVWFTPQGKLAEGVIADYYVPEPGSLALLAAMTGLLARRRRKVS
jgi:hypothetical protein